MSSLEQATTFFSGMAMVVWYGILMVHGLRKRYRDDAG